MEKELKNLIKSELEKEVYMFLNEEVHGIAEIFFGSDRNFLKLVATGGESDANSDEAGECALISAFNTCYEFSKSGIWDGGDVWETMFIYSQFVNFKFPPGFHAGLDESNRNDHGIVLEAAWARLALSPDEYRLVTLLYYSDIEEGFVTKRQMAIVSGLSEETIRTAAYTEGDARLNFSKDGMVEVDEAIRWLKLKGRYQPFTYNVIEEYVPKGKIESLPQFYFFIRSRLEAKGLDLNVIKDVLDENAKASFDNLVNQRFASDAKYQMLDWFDVNAALIVSSKINISPEWLVEAGMKIRSGLHIEGALKQIKRMELPAASNNDTAKTFSIDANLAITPNSIRNVLRDCPWINVHPRQTKENKKMDAYQTVSGKSFTHQHEQKKQYLWVPEQLVVGEGSGLNIDYYPASDLHKDGRYGRHSGLKKYPELESASLARILIQNADELRTVLHLLK